MNKKQAIAYAQVTLNYMQSSNYKKEINSENLGIEMKQTFKLYTNSIILSIAEAQRFANKKIEDMKHKA